MSGRKNYLIWGADPEIFSVYKKDGKPFSLPPVYFRKYLGVKASKDPKHPVFLNGSSYKLHEDGGAFELSINPSKNPQVLFDEIAEAVSEGEKILEQFPEQVYHKFAFLPTVGWDVERWSGESEDFYMATRFGCDPDFDAFDSQKKCTIIDASKHPERYGGGHIHISGSQKILDEPILTIKCLALTAGIAAVAFSDVPDLERARTFLYGMPGKWRPQNYKKSKQKRPEYRAGIEYRTISNRWAGNYDLFTKVFHWAEIGIRNLLEDGLGLELVENLSPVACNAILEADQKTARELLDYINNKL